MKQKKRIFLICAKLISFDLMKKYIFVRFKLNLTYHLQ